MVGLVSTTIIFLWPPLFSFCLSCSIFRPPVFSLHDLEKKCKLWHPTRLFFFWNLPIRSSLDHERPEAYSATSTMPKWLKSLQFLPTCARLSSGHGDQPGRTVAPTVTILRSCTCPISWVAVNAITYGRRWGRVFFFFCFLFFVFFWGGEVFPSSSMRK